MKHPAFLSVALAGLLTGGCATTPMQATQNPLAESSEFILHHSVEIPVGWARTWFQDGASIPLRNLNHYRPWCELEVATVATGPTPIRPAAFRIVDTEHTLEYGGRPAPGGTVRVSLFADDGGHPLLYSRLVYRLQSAENPDVRALICTNGWRDATLSRPVRGTDIERSLGTLASVGDGGR